MLNFNEFSRDPYCTYRPEFRAVTRGEEFGDCTAGQSWRDYEFLIGTKLLHVFMLLKKERDHILNRHSFIPIASKCRLRSVTRLAASRLRVPVVWVWWFKCLCCSVHTLAHVNRARCDSSALYWRRRVPTCCQISSPPRWLKCNGVCRGRGEVPSEKKKHLFVLLIVNNGREILSLTVPRPLCSVDPQ